MRRFNNFYEAIEKNATLNPQKQVLFLDKQKLSNEQLKAKIDLFTYYLQSQKIGFGDKVALIVGNSIEFIVAFFAISKIGAIAVPMNIFLKHEEFEFMLNDCEAKLLVSSNEFEKETSELIHTTTIEKIVWTDEIQTINASRDWDESLRMPTLDDTACIVYTSGTTGKPKGAMLSYRGILSNAIGGQEIFDIKPKDRFLVFLPMFHSFTLSIMVILPIVTNSSIVIVKSVFPFSNVLKQALLKRATVFLGVPTLYNSLVKAKIPWYFMWFNKIRVFISGSAPLSEQVINDFSTKFKKAKLIEGYGLSECSPAVSVNRLDQQKPLSVGLPFVGYEVKIVDDEGIEVPMGDVGEIIVKGDCVMQGYFNRPEANEQTIINGWLKTGDLGRVDEDGFLYIVDRKKDLIISKGINIYPREIEEVLYKYEGVEAAAVIGQKDAISDEQVIAFIQPMEGVDLDEAQIKKYLKEHLANFKIPKHIYFKEELPKNATGKVLKRVLKEEL